jgi:hypothetical protein
MRSSAENLRVLSLTPGRMRLHLRGWTPGGVEHMEGRLGRVPGVERVQASRLTGNVLIRFDTRRTSPNQLLLAAAGAWEERIAEARRGEQPRPGGRSGRGPGPSALVRVGVRGLLGHAAVDALWFGAGFLGRSAGLPLAGLGPLHVLMDVVVWGAALASAGGASRPAPASSRP